MHHSFLLSATHWDNKRSENFFLENNFSFHFRARRDRFDLTNRDCTEFSLSKNTKADLNHLRQVKVCLKTSDPDLELPLTKNTMLAPRDTILQTAHNLTFELKQPIVMLI